MNLLKDIKSENFINWMMTINNMSKEDVLKLTSDNYIHGYCEDFGLYFAIRYNVPLLFLNEEHNIIKIKDKYYDGSNINGIKKLSDLTYVKEFEHLSKLSEIELLSLLKVDEEWRTYKPLANHVHMIERIKNAN